MRKLSRSDLTDVNQECTLVNALELCKGSEVLHESSDDDWLLIRFVNGLQIGIKNGDEAVPYSEVTPDLNYDHPHVFVRIVREEPKTPKCAPKISVPFFDNRFGADENT